MTRKTQGSATTGHHTFAHDSIDSLGYDWERVANPDIRPKDPFKVYLPHTTGDVVQAVREARQLGQQLAIRGNGHSSNDLVLADRGHVLSFQRMNRVLGVDADGPTPTVTAQAGASLIEVDDALSSRGLGLPVLGDHRHLTAGGFASVGGVSPASHRYGLFIDNIQALEYVTLDGEVAECGRAVDVEQFNRLLTGRGQHGIITSLTLDVIRVDKHRQLLENDRRVIREVDEFVEHALRQMADPEVARLQRGYWVDVALARGGRLRFGQWSDYREITATPAQRQRRDVSHVARRALGTALGLAPNRLARAAKIVGVSAVVFAPPYVSVRDAEQAADNVLDFTVGDPTRWFAAWAPLANYASVFHRLHELFCAYRERTGCFTFIAVLMQAIRSPYLSRGSDETHGAVMMICGVRPDRLTDDVLSSLVSEMDDICIEEGALRYLHSLTSKDPKRERLLDPNAPYSDASDAATR